MPSPSEGYIRRSCSGPKGIIEESVAQGVKVVGDHTGSSCKRRVKITCTLENKCGNQNEASMYITIMTGWSTKGEPVNDVPADHPGRVMAEKQERSEYYYIDENGQWFKYKRSSPCGSASPTPTPYCMEDTRTGFLYWDYSAQDHPYNYDGKFQKYAPYVVDEDGTGRDWVANSPYKYRDDIKTAKKCRTQFGCTNPIYPKAQTVPDPSSLSASSSCNEVNTITTINTDPNDKYHKHCGVKGGDTIDDRIYSIDCEETMKTAFNGPVWDNKNSFMYAGTGFKFNYQVKTKVECIGKWHEDFYTKAKTYAEDYLDGKKTHHKYEHGVAQSCVKQEGIDEVAEKNWFDSALEGMTKIRKSYINWSLKSIYFSQTEASGEIKDVQPNPTTAGRSKDEYSEALELWDSSTGKKMSYNDTKEHPTSECYSKTAQGNPTQKGDKGDSPDNFSYQVAYTFNFRLPILYYTKDRTYTTTECTNCQALGRIFPISENEDYAEKETPAYVENGDNKFVSSSGYRYEVKIINLGLKHNWTNTESCDIKMKKKDVIFRSINLTDPFIQKLEASNHEIGRNWKNDKYDFTKVIDVNTWNKSSQYNTVSIDQELGKLIKAELVNNSNSYLGACANQTSAGQTPQICALLKQAKK